VAVSEDTSARVVVVDDEEDVADLYATWLDGDHQVETAYDGESALEAIDENVDVLFLDRQMPGTTGDEVLDRLDDSEVDCRVVMVTAVDPDFDIVSMPFDDYLTKPVSRTDLETSVSEMLRRERYDDQLQEYFSMASKKATPESEKKALELDDHEEYREVSRRVEELREQADETADELDDFESAFRDFPSG
jgi:DNA-binding response OmpR family regulator